MVNAGEIKRAMLDRIMAVVPERFARQSDSLYHAKRDPPGGPFQFRSDKTTVNYARLLV